VRNQDADILRLKEELRMTRTALRESQRQTQELEDTIRMKEELSEVSDRQVQGAMDQVHILQAELDSTKSQLEDLKEHQSKVPVTESDLYNSWQRQHDLINRLRESLSCPMCYEPLPKDDFVALQCGHTFCSSCFTKWTESHRESFRNNPHLQGVYKGAECPECRAPIKTPASNKWRVWALEEIVRLLARGARDDESEQKAREKMMQLGFVKEEEMGDGAETKENDRMDTSEDEEDPEEVAALLEDRPRMPYSTSPPPPSSMPHRASPPPSMPSSMSPPPSMPSPSPS